ncbi:MAG TPA: Ig-like domain-containing protein [Mobilitalea sp.]|nr:Ig-like domain-containing protein [Mobilitalea sp.]
MKKIVSFLLIITLLYAVVPATDVYAAIKLITKLTMDEGKTYTLKLTGTNKTVTWSSSNKKVASVSNKGKVTAINSGNATITAKVSGKSYKCKITVNEDYSEWVLYDTDNLGLLADNIIDGYVIYMNGKFYCSPEYFNMLYNAQIAYENDIADDVYPSRDILTSDEEFIFSNDYQKEIDAENDAAMARIVLMMKYGFASSEDMDTEIGKAYMKFCDEWISEYELENSFDISVVPPMMDDKLYLIIDVDNNYIIYNAQEKPVSKTIYTDGSIRYQYLDKFTYKGVSYNENQYYFNRADLIAKGIIK